MRPTDHSASRPTTPAPVDPLADNSPFTLAVAFLLRKRYATAETYLGDFGKDRFRNPRPTTLRHWREVYYRHTGAAYERLEIEDLRSDLNEFLNRQQFFGKGGAAFDLRVTEGLKRDVLGQIRDIAQARVSTMPAWLDHRDKPEPRDVLAFANGLLNLQQWLINPAVDIDPPTPLWFSTSASPCEFDPVAECPTWLKFLDASLSGDPELIGQLQEWFGYCLTEDTSLQKMLWLHGPGGAGKGTIMRTLRRVVGERNTVSFDLWSLGERFTLSSFVGKKIAMSGDAVLGNDKDSRKIMGRLNGISGEDPQQIDRKNKDLIESFQLSTRFVIAINAFPRMPESGNAMGRRAVLIPFKKSFVGMADSDLDAKLALEVAGITNWALDGLRRLRERGDFATTVAGDQLKERFVSLMFPMKAFVDDCCLKVDYRAEKRQSKAGFCRVDDMYLAYAIWCRRNGHKAASKPHFGESLHDAILSLERVRAGDEEGEDGRYYEYRGVELRTEVQMEVNTQREHN